MTLERFQSLVVLRESSVFLKGNEVLISYLLDRTDQLQTASLCDENGLRRGQNPHIFGAVISLVLSEHH